MKIENITSRQWDLYNWLKHNAVGKKNIKTRKEISGSIDLSYGDYEEVQSDIRALRLCPELRDICSGNKGYYLPISDEERSYYLKGRALGHLVTALATGEISKKEVYKLLNDIDINRPLDEQMKLVLGRNENDTHKRLSNDLDDPYQSLKKLTRDELITLYFKLGGSGPYPLSREDYYVAITELQKEEERRLYEE